MMSRPVGVVPTDSSDDRLRERERVLLRPENFAPTLLSDDTADGLRVYEFSSRQDLDLLISSAYESSRDVRLMAGAILDPSVSAWPKELRVELKEIEFGECSVLAHRIYYRDRLYIPKHDVLRLQIVHSMHALPQVGHQGMTKTKDLLSRTYFWPGMAADADKYVKACHQCHRSKPSRSPPKGLLKPLAIPVAPWRDISVDFITPLPTCRRAGTDYRHLMVVVDRLTKMRHFIACSTMDAAEVANLFVSRIFCLHGAPDTIVSDRGTNFVSQLWTQISQRLGIKITASTAFHPETDGQTERVNAVLEMYLRNYVTFHQDDWADWLPLAEFASNNAISETTRLSPFFANYGFHPMLGIEPPKPQPVGLSTHQAKEWLRAEEITKGFAEILQYLQESIRESQERQEFYANQGRVQSPRYAAGDWVWLNTGNVKTRRPNKKLDDRQMGPFKVVKTYTHATVLSLPKDMRVFPVFHNLLLTPAAAPSAGMTGQAEINKATDRKNLGIQAVDGFADRNEVREVGSHGLGGKAEASSTGFIGQMGRSRNWRTVRA